MERYVWHLIRWWNAVCIFVPKKVFFLFVIIWRVLIWFSFCIMTRHHIIHQGILLRTNKNTIRSHSRCNNVPLTTIILESFVSFFGNWDDSSSCFGLCHQWYTVALTRWFGESYDHGFICVSCSAKHPWSPNTTVTTALVAPPHHPQHQYLYLILLVRVPITLRDLLY